MDRKPLEDLGMTPKESEVYLVLISLKSASIFEIMSRAKISRKSIYEILQKLLDKGLISHTTKDGKKTFSAAHPERLLEILKEKEQSLNAILPELSKKYHEKKEDLEVEVFLGNEGIKTVCNNILKVGMTMYAVSGNGEMYEHLPYYTAQYLKKRENIGIHRYAVYNESVRGKRLTPPLTEIRYAPPVYSSPLQFTVYGDHVNIHIYSDVNVTVHIYNKNIAEAFLNYFRLMWEISKK